MNQLKKNPPSAPALLYGLSVLEEVCASPTPMRFAALEQASGAARSTLIRLLRILVDEGWLEKERGGYMAGPRLTALRNPQGIEERLRSVSHPLLEELAASSGNTAGVFAVAEEENVLVDKVIHPAAVTMRDIGSRRGLEGTSPWGWIILQGKENAVLDAAVPDAIRTEVEQAWSDLDQKGWCMDDQVGMDLVCRMAVPLSATGSGSLFGVLALAGNPLTMPAERRDDLAGMLLEYAERITSRMI